VVGNLVLASTALNLDVVWMLLLKNEEDTIRKMKIVRSKTV
jgi:hypothetical protein